MKKIILLATMLGSSLAAISQTHVKQYFYVAGGNFNATNKVKVGVVKGNQDLSIDSIKGQFSNAATIFHDKRNVRYEGLAHIGRSAGNDLIVRYDLDSYKVIDSVGSAGVTAFARNQSKLVVVKGYASTGAKVDILNANDLSTIASISEIKNNCSDVEIYGDSAFVSHSLPVKSGYPDSVGYVSIIDLRLNKLVNTISLGAIGKGASNLIISKEMDGRLHIYYSNYGKGQAESVDNMVFHSVVGTRTLAVTDKHIFGIKKTNPLTSIIVTKAFDDTTSHITNISSKNLVGSEYDTVSNLYLILKTDYATYGKLFRYSFTANKVIDSTSVGVSTTALAVDYRPGVILSLAKDESSSNMAFVYPNPCKDVLTINNLNNSTTWEVKSQLGQSIAAGTFNSSEEKIRTEEMAKGVYFLVLSGNTSQKTIKFVKE